jgi:hypothetical protein
VKVGWTVSDDVNYADLKGLAKRSAIATTAASSTDAVADAGSHAGPTGEQPQLQLEGDSKQQISDAAQAAEKARASGKKRRDSAASKSSATAKVAKKGVRFPAPTSSTLSRSKGVAVQTKRLNESVMTQLKMFGRGKEAVALVDLVVPAAPEAGARVATRKAANAGPPRLPTEPIMCSGLEMIREYAGISAEPQDTYDYYQEVPLADPSFASASTGMSIFMIGVLV